MIGDVEIGMKLLGCLNRMWMIFTKIVEVNREKEIEEFLEAKEEAHRIISCLSGGKDGV